MATTATNTNADASGSSPKPKLLFAPAVDPGKTFKLEAADSYHQCYHRLRPQIAFLLEYFRLNKSWIPQEKVTEFDEIFKDWLDNLEKKKTGGSLKELITRRGHTEVMKIWERILALRNWLDEEGKKYPLTPLPPPPGPVVAKSAPVNATAGPSTVPGPVDDGEIQLQKAVPA